MPELVDKASSAFRRRALMFAKSEEGLTICAEAMIINVSMTQFRMDTSSIGV